jgi:3(or 17)beta-hydroxysteroid dehydrogenase
MQKLKSKVALVTGGATGLGKAIAQRLASEGASVIITDVQAAVGQAAAADCGFTFFEHDVTNQDQWQRIVDQVEAQYGALHVLVNNAGITGPMDCSNPENIRLSDWQSVQGVNVDGVVLGCRSAIPLMRRSGGGSIINISSIAALLPGPDTMAYAASKAAVRHVTTSVAIHCAKTGSKIRCNSVHPGTCLTSMVQNGAAGMAKRRGITAEQVIEEMRSHIPQGEFIEAEDIANAVLFLASDEARRITGAKLVVDGGQTCE